MATIGNGGTKTGSAHLTGGAAWAICALLAVACFMDVPATLNGERTPAWGEEAASTAGAVRTSGQSPTDTCRNAGEPVPSGSSGAGTTAASSAAETIDKSGIPLAGSTPAPNGAGVAGLVCEIPARGAAVASGLSRLCWHLREWFGAFLGGGTQPVGACPEDDLYDPMPAVGYTEPDAVTAPDAEPVWVEDTPAWDEILEVSPTWDEQVWVEEAPAWEEQVWVEDTPAWEEQVWVEDSPAWDEQTVETWTVFHYDGYRSQLTADILAHAEELALQHLTASYYDEYVYGSVHHEAEGHWETVAHEAAGHWETVRHDAIGHWETVRHDPETTVVHHEAQGHWE